MTKKQFKYDFLRGLGSALLELQGNNNRKKFRDIVLYGCLHITSFDPQCEGDRGWYLYNAALLVEENSYIEKTVIEISRIFIDSSWLFEQITSILYCYANDGSENARDALYQKYTYLINFLSSKRKFEEICNQRDMFNSLCVYLLKLDKWSAFKKIVQETSEILLMKDEDYFFSEWFYDISKNIFGKKRVEEYLCKQAKKSTFMYKYYEKAKEWDSYVYSKRPVITLEHVINETNGQGFRNRGLAIQFVKSASFEDLEKLAQLAIEEPDISRKSELLWGFRFRPYNFPLSLIFKWSKSENQDLRDTAFYIMGQNPNKQLYDYAVELIENEVDIQNGLFLLCKNYRADDEEFLFDTLKHVLENDERYDFHYAAMNVEEALSSSRHKPKTDILQYMYSHTTCSSCRYRYVILMHKKKVLQNVFLIQIEILGILQRLL